jgi:hypothetical protein
MMIDRPWSVFRRLSEPAPGFGQVTALGIGDTFFHEIEL